MPWEQPIAKNTEKTIMGFFSCGKNSKLLDFGAGNGRYLEMFSKYIDKDNLYAAELNDTYYSRITSLGYNCFKPDTANPHLPFESDYFDCIFSSNVIEHIPNHQYKVYLKEFYRVLRKNGTFIVGTPNYPFKRIYDFKKAFKTKMYKYYFFDDPTHINKLSIMQLERDLKAIFQEVCLLPSYIFFEEKFRIVKANRMCLRRFADKITGYCRKLA